MNILSDPLSVSTNNNGSSGSYRDNVTMSGTVGTRKGYGSMLGGGSGSGGVSSSRKPYATASVDPPGRWKPSVFDFKSGRTGSTCPTCKGSGRIPKGHEDELVALIPYNDDRLKPRRTCLYLSIVGVILLVVGGILTAFMFPRSVSASIVSINNVSRTHDFLIKQYKEDNTSYDAILGIETIINFKNRNFFPVRVSFFNVTVTYTQDQVGIKEDGPFLVESRTSKNVSIMQNITFVTPQSEKIETICMEDRSWRNEIYLIANVFGEYSYLAQTFAFLVKKGDYVSCSNASIILTPSTIMPPH